MSKSQNSLVSIIITNNNGLQHIKECLPSIENQTYQNIEVIIVDNNSSDGSASFIKSNFPKIKLLRSKDNLGYAAGNNKGFEESKGEYILILNNDTILDSNLVEKLLYSIKKSPNVGAVQPKIKLQYDESLLDSCGSFWTSTGINYHIGNYKSESLDIYNKPFYVYSLKGVCMLIPRKVIEVTGLFDEKFWCYFEETDFCHRVWLSGFKCLYDPCTSVIHALGGTSLKKRQGMIQFHSFKNRFRSYLKNLGYIEMLKVVPVYVLLSLIWSIYYLLSNNLDCTIAIYKAYVWNIIHMKDTLIQRKHIQQTIRATSDEEIFSIVKKNPQLDYYLKLVLGLQKYSDNL